MRKTPAQARSRATIDAILTAATRLLFEIGYEKTTTNKIAEVAGVSIGSLYEYFPGKEAIFVEIRRRRDRKMYEPEYELPASVRDWVRSHTSIYLRHIRSNLSLYAALLSEVPRHVLRPQYYVDIHYIPWLTEFLDNHQDDLHPCASSNELAEFVSHVWKSTVDDYILSAPEKLNDPAFERMLIDLVERFLLKP